MENTPAHTQLRAWLKSEGRMSAWLADKLGVTQQTVSAWMNGHRLPITPQRREIERLTDGAVRADSWV
jgi:hypothetical protein